MPWYGAAMADNHKDFDLYLELLRRIVTARGGDAARLNQEYAWPGGGGVDVPKAAMSLSPLLTGGQVAPSPAFSRTEIAAPSGVVPVPTGLVPPKA